MPSSSKVEPGALRRTWCSGTGPSWPWGRCGRRCSLLACMGREVLTGWGRTAPSAAEVVRPADAGSVAAALASPGPRGAIARGLGRSYGDAAQNAGGTVVATAALDHIAWSDEAAGLLGVGAGTSLEAILRGLVPRGWFVPVSPGTRSVSVGGAIPADVHGKNLHADGSFASHCTSLTLATPVCTREP